MRTRTAYTLHGAFPKYEHVSRRCVDARMLQLAKMRATQHFTEHADEYRRVFTQYVTRRLRCKPSAVKFDPLQKSLKRIRSAVLFPADDHFGWTDGEVIRVCCNYPMGFDQLVGTLVHEELHCFCKARCRFLGTATEHHCMCVLGET